ncbi:MAG: winged helix-turn-helix domain-containing protein, partial [Chloroflexi bacterium]|nr:winged helix-turn-helix domain-containing protein [Chloroflexota bacterium]
MATISIAQARRLAVRGALLAGPRPPADAEGIMAVVRHLGGLQIDPTRAVERTHLLVLWSR